MDNEVISPWDVSVKKISPDGQYRAEITDAGEVAMGAPTLGKLRITHLETSQCIAEVDSVNPSVAWADDSSFLAFPKWTSSRLQHLGVYQVKERQLIFYPKTFTVLKIYRCHLGMISFVDSPLHKPQKNKIQLSEIIDADKSFRQLLMQWGMSAEEIAQHHPMDLREFDRNDHPVIKKNVLLYFDWKQEVSEVKIAIAELIRKPVDFFDSIPDEDEDDLIDLDKTLKKIDKELSRINKQLFIIDTNSDSYTIGVADAADIRAMLQLSEKAKLPINFSGHIPSFMTFYLIGLGVAAFPWMVSLPALLMGYGWYYLSYRHQQVIRQCSARDYLLGINLGLSIALFIRIASYDWMPDWHWIFIVLIRCIAFIVAILTLMGIFQRFEEKYNLWCKKK